MARCYSLLSCARRENSNIMVLRTVTCLKQIWIEVLRGSEASYNQQVAQSIGRSIGFLEGWKQAAKQHRIPNYGKQRVMVRNDASEMEITLGYRIVEAEPDDAVPNLIRKEELNVAQQSADRLSMHSSKKDSNGREKENSPVPGLRAPRGTMIPQEGPGATSARALRLHSARTAHTASLSRGSIAMDPCSQAETHVPVPRRSAQTHGPARAVVWLGRGDSAFYESSLAAGFGCFRNKRSISRLASGPRGSVYDPPGLPLTGCAEGARRSSPSSRNRLCWAARRPVLSRNAAWTQSRRSPSECRGAGCGPPSSRAFGDHPGRRLGGPAITDPDRPAHEHRDPPRALCLGADPERPRGRAANSAEPRDDLPSPHSITSSARARRVGAIVSPMLLAVFKFMTSSNFVGPCTGSSAGRAPFKMRST